MSMKPALFLDRDGTINVEINYLHEPEKVVLEHTVAEAIALANAQGWLVIVVTNQSGIARGYYTDQHMHSVHERIQQLLKPYGAHIDAWFWCPHHPEVTGICACRKPGTAMLQQATQEWPIDLARSWLVGDKALDVQAGLNAGCQAIMVRTGYGADHQHQAPTGVPIVDTLLEAVQIAIQDS